MNARVLSFLSVLSLLAAYTGLHAAQLMPGSAFAALAGMVVGVLLLFVWQLTYRYESFPHAARWARALAWTTSVAMGAWSTFLFLCAAADIASLFGLRPALGAALAAGGSGVVAVLGVAEALRGPRVRRVAIRIAGLAAGLEGLRIVQISDLHVGPTIRRPEVERVVERALALEPDLIAITGDLVDGHVQRLASCVEPLARLKAPFGVYYVTGNHEYYWDAPAWVEKARELGFIALLNESRVVERGGAKLLVGGVTDEAAGLFAPSEAPDFERAASSTEKPDLRLLLAHRPTGYARAERAGFDLQLSGHTHGGQFFPWSLVIRLFHRYHRGLNRHGRLRLYVSAGAGYWGPALRFGVPAEIAVLTLLRDA